MADAQAQLKELIRLQIAGFGRSLDSVLVEKTLGIIDRVSGQAERQQLLAEFLVGLGEAVAAQRPASLPLPVTRMQSLAHEVKNPISRQIAQLGVLYAWSAVPAPQLPDAAQTDTLAAHIEAIELRPRRDVALQLLRLARVRAKREVATCQSMLAAAGRWSGIEPILLRTWQQTVVALLSDPELPGQANLLLSALTHGVPLGVDDTVVAHWVLDGLRGHEGARWESHLPALLDAAARQGFRLQVFLDTLLATPTPPAGNTNTGPLDRAVAWVTRNLATLSDGDANLARSSLHLQLAPALAGRLPGKLELPPLPPPEADFSLAGLRLRDDSSRSLLVARLSSLPASSSTRRLLEQVLTRTVQAAATGGSNESADWQATCERDIQSISSLSTRLATCRFVSALPAAVDRAETLQTWLSLATQAPPWLRRRGFAEVFARDWQAPFSLTRTVFEHGVAAGVEPDPAWMAGAVERALAAGEPLDAATIRAVLGKDALAAENIEMKSWSDAIATAMRQQRFDLMPNVIEARTRFARPENQGAAIAFLLENKSRLALLLDDRRRHQEIAEEVISIDSLFHQFYAAAVVGLDLVSTEWGRNHGLELLEEARELLPDITDRARNDDALRLFAEGLSATALTINDAKMVRRAAEFAEKIGDSRVRGLTLATIIRALGRFAGQRADPTFLVTATELLAGELSDEARATCSSIVGFHQARLGMREEARQTVTQIEAILARQTLSADDEQRLLEILREIRQALITRPVVVRVPGLVRAYLGQTATATLEITNTTRVPQRVRLRLVGADGLVADPTEHECTVAGAATEGVVIALTGARVAQYNVGLTVATDWGEFRETLALQVVPALPQITVTATWRDGPVALPATGVSRPHPRDNGAPRTSDAGGPADGETACLVTIASDALLEQVRATWNEPVPRVLRAPELATPWPLSGTWSGEWVFGQPVPETLTLVLSARDPRGRPFTSELTLPRPASATPGSETTRTCPHCRDTNPSGTHFCRTCGRPLAEQ